ncbi:MAG: PKD domain-containing protein, partial [Crocinitomix sp.]|nr:PKD domain-containing protein [Crocinitomix sp.]
MIHLLSNKSQLFKQFLLCAVLVISGQSINAQTILPTNGSPEDDAAAPTGWTILVGSTDISNKTYWAGWAAYPWEDTPEDPPNGHLRWVTGFYTESVGTTISDLTDGVEYTMSFYMAEMRSNAGGTPTLFDGTLKVTIGGVDYLYPFSGGTDNSWSLQELTFTADATEMAMSFKYDGTPGVNGNFWNISFSEDVVDPDCDELTTTVSATDICIGEEVTLTAESINDGVITWDGGVVDGEAFEPPLGTTTFTATSDNDLDCVFSVDITVHDLPDVTATAEPEEICLGQTVTFTGGGAETYEWDMDVEDGVPFEPLTTGVETYTVTGTSEFGCVNTASVDVTVSPLPTCDFEFVINGFSSEDGATGGCVVSTVEFNDLSTVGDPGTITEWDWDFGDGSGSDEENPEHVYGAAGTYTITLTVTTAGGCSATYELDIIMTEALIMDLVFNDPTCFGFTDGSVTVNVTGGLGDLIFEITDADDVVLNEDNSNTANTLGEGWYYFNVTDDSECSGLDSVYLSQPGELDIEIDLTHPLCFGFETGTAVVTDVINNTGADDMISYIWNPNPGGNSGLGEN